MKVVRTELFDYTLVFTEDEFEILRVLAEEMQTTTEKVIQDIVTTILDQKSEDLAEGD